MYKFQVKFQRGKVVNQQVVQFQEIPEDTTAKKYALQLAARQAGNLSFWRVIEVKEIS